MIDKRYFILRKLFFWVFTALFVFLAPFLIYYSLGYKFNLGTKKFVRTGIISVESQPEGAKVLLNKKDIGETAPCAIRDILPGRYDIVVEKRGFYPYKVCLNIKPNLVKKVKAVLIPFQKNIEKIAFNFNVYRFFSLKSFFNTKFVAFTDKGIYLVDRSFNKIQCLTRNTLDEDTISSIRGVLVTSSLPLFWSKNNIWEIKKDEIIDIYKAEELIKNVLWGPRRRYILVQDGLRVIALDVKEPRVRIKVFKLRSIKAQFYYSVSQDILYVKDKIPGGNKFSLFKIKTKSLTHFAGENFLNEYIINKN